MNTEIYIENFRLDVSANISTLLNFAIDDVRDFSNRSTKYSKTIVLPGTQNNNRIFGHIFNIGQSNVYDPSMDNVGYNFNASKGADCIIFQDQMQTFKGVLRLMEIVITSGRVEYEVSVFGDLAGLNSVLSNGLLEDLDFSAYNELWNETNIVASWDATPGSGVYYPLMDYGLYSTNKHDWDFRTCRPALYVKEYIDKMFAAAGYRYSSDLFDTDRFKGLIIPHNQKILVKLSNRILTASNGTQQHIIDRDADVGLNDVFFDSIVGGLFTDTDGKLFTYTGTDTIAVTLNITFSGFYNFDAIPPSTTDYHCEIFVRQNLIEIYDDPVFLTDNSGHDTNFTRTYTLNLTLAQNDTFEISFRLQGGPAGEADVFINTASLIVNSVTIVSTPVDYAEEIDLNFAIPKNIKQIDFLLGIVKLFNLYVYEDRFDSRLIYLKPYVDFYSTDSANSVDWTYKVNRDKPIKVKPMSELNAKRYEFKFKSDSDYYNDIYRKRYSQGYGDYIFTSEFEFAEQTKSFEIVFSATPLVGYVGEDKVYATIFKRTGPDSSPVEEHVDSNIRILQTKKIEDVTSWDLMNDASVLDSLTVYGYAGHFDDPDAPSNDLNFGALSELFFLLLTGNLSVSQFNVYYSGYMAEITDKDSKLVTANFYLTPKDIFELDFSKFIYMDGVLFRLNKIEDYNMSKPSDCSCQLLKVNFLIY